MHKEPPHSGHTAGVFDQNVVFQSFPTDPALFLPDVAGLVEDIVQRHGPEEWTLCVLTTAMHHHLGIYALLGAKMGLKAREILGAGFGVLEVVSFAGRQPPLSCFNDGLQVSTGSTLGHGKIRVADEPRVRVEAHFFGPQGGLSMRLRTEYGDRIAADVAQCTEQQGNLTAAYFGCVRGLALRYWLEWSRHDVFDCEMLKQ